MGCWLDGDAWRRCGLDVPYCGFRAPRCSVGCRKTVPRTFRARKRGRRASAGRALDHRDQLQRRRRGQGAAKQVHARGGREVGPLDHRGEARVVRGDESRRRDGGGGGRGGGSCIMWGCGWRAVDSVALLCSGFAEPDHTSARRPEHVHTGCQSTVCHPPPIACVGNLGPSRVPRGAPVHTAVARLAAHDEDLQHLGRTHWPGALIPPPCLVRPRRRPVGAPHYALATAAPWPSTGSTGPPAGLTL